MPTSKTKFLFAAIFLSLAGCSTSLCPFQSSKNQSGEYVYAAKTIPVSRLEIKVLENQNKNIKSKPVLKETSQVSNITSSSNKLSSPRLNLQNTTMEYLAETIYFSDGSSELSAADYAKIRKIAKKIKEKNASVSVYGFASSRTKNTDIASHKLINFNISADRAENVAKALRQYGVASNKISVEALSDSKPVYLEVMPKGESLNRRVEIFSAY